MVPFILKISRGFFKVFPLQYTASSSHHYSPPRKLRMGKIIPQVLGGVPALPPVTDTMKGILDWMKSKRIHKYWPVFSRMSYSAIVGLTEDNIDEILAVIGASPITSGARYHILRCTENLRDRVADVSNIDEYTAPCDVADIIQRIAASPLSSTEPETSGDFLLQLLRSKLDFLFEVHGSPFFAHCKIKKALEGYTSRPEVPNFDKKHIMNLQRNGSNDCEQSSPADNISLIETDFKTAASMEGTQEPHELPRSISRPETTRLTELRDIETRVVQPSASTSTGIPSSPFYSQFTKLQPAQLSSPLPSARVLSDTYSAEQSQCQIDCSRPKYQHHGLFLQFLPTAVNIPLLEKDLMQDTQEAHELQKSIARPEATRPTELRDIETRVVPPSACTSTGIPSSPFYSPFTKLQPAQLSSPLPSARVLSDTYSAEQSQCPIDCSWPKYQHLGLLMKTMKLSYDKVISTVDVNRTWGGGRNQVMVTSPKYLPNYYSLIKLLQWIQKF